ncbi:MAG: hypothetical protein GY714_25565 [Desulfobacterales bacterium]|nr:hypothetical protein [Desulfobacterales bacterium]
MDSDKLILYSKLKIYVKNFKDQKLIDESEYNSIYNTLDKLCFDLFNENDIESFENLLNIFKKIAPEKELNLFNNFLKAEKLRKINERRYSSIQKKSYFDPTDIFDDIDPFSLSLYDWDKTYKSFRKLIETLKSEISFESAIKECKIFFDTGGVLSIPSDFPYPTDNLIKNLLKKSIISKDLINPLSSDTNLITRELSKSKKEISHKLNNDFITIEDFNIFGDISKNFIHDICFSGNSNSFSKYIISWNGPGKAQILSDWWEMGDKNSQISELIMAFSDINPALETGKWHAWVREKTIHNNQGLNRFKDLIHEHKELYELSLILSFGDIIPNINIWETVLNNTKLSFQNDIELLKTETISKQPPPIPMKTAPPPIPKKNQVDNIYEDVHEAISSTLDFEVSEDIVIPRKIETKEDKFVEQESSWNLYLKPFLNENWLGLIGASSLMVAWLFLSIWLWDRGPFYRLIAGAIPMIMTTLGLGWISSFFYKLRDDGSSSKAAVLFSCLSLLSVPFNILISLSMLKTESFGIGFSLIGVYFFSIILLSRWIGLTLGFNPSTHLLLLNSLLVIPIGIKTYISNSLFIEPSMFAGFFFSCHIVYKNRKNINFSFKSLYLLFGGNYFLSISILFLYFRVLPDQGSIALLIQLSALTFLTLSKDKETTFIITACCLSILSLFFGFNTQLFAICFILGTSFWIFLQKKLSVKWGVEIVSIFLILIPGVIIYSYFKHNIPFLLNYSPLLFILSIFMVFIYEEKFVNQESKILSYILPLILLSNVLLININNGFIFTTISILIYGFYCFKRYTRWYRRNLWFLNTFLVVYVPTISLLYYYKGLTGNISFSILPATILTFIFCCLSKKTDNTFTKRYDTSILWIFSGINSFLIILYFFNFTFEPDLTILCCLLFTIISLFFSAHRSGSVIPVYLLFGLTGLSATIIKSYLGIETKSGLGMAFGSLLMLIASGYFKNKSFSKKEIQDLFFNFEFPLKVEKYFTSSMKVIAVILIFGSMLKAFYNFKPVFVNGEFSIDGIKILIVLMLNIGISGFIIEKYKIKFTGVILLFPLIASLISILSVIPDFALPHMIVITLLLFGQFTGIIKNKLSESIFHPFRLFEILLYVLSVPFTFSGYYFLFIIDASLIYFITYSLLVISFTHFSIFKYQRKIISHINILHILTMWYMTLLLLKLEKAQILHIVSNFNPDPFTNINVIVNTFMFLAGPFVFVLPVYFMEKSSHITLSDYSNSAHFWFKLLALLYVPTMGFTFFTQIDYPYIYFIIGVVLVYAGSRKHDLFFTEFFKGLACSFCTVKIMNFNPLIGIFSGLTLYTIINSLLYYTTQKSIRVLSIKKPFNYGIRNAWIVHIFILVFLMTHISTFILDYNLFIPNYLLYLLIPWFIFLKVKLKYEYLAYAGIGLFAYANIFSALYFKNRFLAIDLNTIHLLSTTLVLSILCYYALILIFKGPANNFMSKRSL